VEALLVDDEEESLAAQMEELAVKEASEATGLTVAQLQRRAEKDMQARIWSAMEPDRIAELGFLVAQGLGDAKSGGALHLLGMRRQPSPVVGIWVGYGLELTLGSTPPGLSGAQDYWPLVNPFLETTDNDASLVERVRAISTYSWAGRLVGRIAHDVGSSPMRVMGQIGLGWSSHRSMLVHEQYTLDDAGVERPGSAVNIQNSVSYNWAAPELSASLGGSYRLPGGRWRIVGRGQWQQTMVGRVDSFLNVGGEQSTLGLVLGVSGGF
jgi:hypothetical protein